MSTRIEEFFKEDLKRLNQLVKGKTRADVKVSFYDLKTGKEYNVEGDQPGWAASTIKVPVMVAAFREIDEGRLGLDEKLLVDHKFTLDPTSEISSRPQGSEAEVYELLNYMILASCNESTNMLANRIGLDKINDLMRALGCPNTRISHLLHRGAPLLDRGIDGTSSNTTTANELTKIMAGIYRDEIASGKSSEHMRHILENDPAIEYGYRSINTYISGVLPPGTIVGTKCGVLDKDVMSTAVVNRDYALTVMVNKIPESKLSKGSNIIRAVSREVFDRYYNE